MKKLLSTVLFATTLVLTACGGGSSSSSGSSNQPAKPQKEIALSVEKTISNNNVYKCYSQEALDSCTDDKTCGIAKCTFIKGIPPALNLDSCKFEGNNVWGKKGASCQFTIADKNDGKPMILTCDTQGKITFKSDINDEEGIEGEQIPSVSGTKFLRCE